MINTIILYRYYFRENFFLSSNFFTNKWLPSRPSTFVVSSSASGVACKWLERSSYFWVEFYLLDNSAFSKIYVVVEQLHVCWWCIYPTLFCGPTPWQQRIWSESGVWPNLAISRIAKFVNMGESNFKRSRNLRTGRQKSFWVASFWVSNHRQPLPSALWTQNCYPNLASKPTSWYGPRLLLAAPPIEFWPQPLPLSLQSALWADLRAPLQKSYLY